MTGWRLGYVIAPRAFVRALQALHRQLLHLDQRVRAVGGPGRAARGGRGGAPLPRVFDQRRRAMVAGLRRDRVRRRRAAHRRLLRAGQRAALHDATPWPSPSRSWTGPTWPSRPGSTSGTTRRATCGSLHRVPRADRGGPVAHRPLPRDAAPDERAHDARPPVTCASAWPGRGELHIADLPTLRRVLQRGPVLPGLGLRGARADTSPSSTDLDAAGARRPHRGREPRSPGRGSRPLRAGEDELRAPRQPGRAHPLASHPAPRRRPGSASRLADTADPTTFPRRRSASASPPSPARGAAMIPQTRPPGLQRHRSA